jgi:hypothetical protein
MQWHRKLGWNPSDLGWRVAVLFMVGAFLFMLGSFPAYALLVDPSIVGVTFVIGSVFFTSAGYSQFLQVINTPNESGIRAGSGTFRFWSWHPRTVLWWATVVQLLGTVFFNYSTIHAMIDGLSAKDTERLVWAPDFFGSIAFLVASHLAWYLVCRGIWCVKRSEIDWWIAALNYTGSIFFMVSALAAFILPTTGEVANITVVNSATMVGAGCFFVGAYLLLPPIGSRSEATSRS